MPLPTAISHDPSFTVHFGQQAAQLHCEGDKGVLDLPMPVLSGGAQETLTLPGARIHRSDRLLLVENETHLVGAAAVPVPDRLEDPVQATYAAVLEACTGRGMHLHRVWNYVPEINTHSQGLEHYRQFNIGRWLAFEQRFGRDLRSFMPAASAVGISGDHYAMCFIAGRTQPLYLENPAQMPSYHYPADYGPRPPSFARAVLVGHPRGTMGYLSGTASIEGHRSIGEGDWHTQFRTTMHNIRIMFERMGMSEALDENAAKRAGLVVRDFRCYVRHPEAAPLLQEWLAEEAGHLARNVVLLQADICRAELDIEMEAILSKRA